MANFSYPVSSVIGGVSNLEYAIRMDSQSTTQSNCLLSGKYGLCKRPSSEYITTLKTHTGNAAEDFSGTVRAPANKFLMHTITYGSDERLLIGTRGQGPDVSALFKDSPVPDGESWVLVNPSDGGLNVITHFPSSANVAKSAIRAYEDLNGSVYLDPAKVSFATLGDNTYINFDGVSPAMKTTTWAGYSETYNSTSGTASSRTILNDEVFAIWCKAHQAGKQSYNVSVAIKGYNGDAAYVESLECGPIEDDAMDSWHYAALGQNIKNDTKTIANALALQMSGVAVLEATTLNLLHFPSDTVDNATSMGYTGTSVITGRIFDDFDPLGNDGSNFKPSQLLSVEAEGGRGSSNIKALWKTADGVADLPPRSWIDHTLKIEDSSSGGGDPFYMKFVSDELDEVTYSMAQAYPTADNRAFGTHTSFGTDNIGCTSSTTKLPRAGHWEEYCGVGVETDVDSATLPHVMVKRSDGSFIMTEARGAFQVNSATPASSWVAASNSLTITVDGGFSEDGTADADGGIVTGTYVSALIPGDSLEFRGSASESVLPDEIVPDKTYFIKTVTKTSARVYTVTLSATSKGDTLAITDPSGGAITGQNLKCFLTSYDYLKWSDRIAGDDETNPLPDLFYRPINKIFTYQNRLGFVTDKEVWFSGSGDPGGLFRSTVRDLLEDDPFGITPTDSRGDVIKDAVAYDQTLIVFTNEAQHLVRSLDGRFSSKTVEVVAGTHAACDFNPTPVPINDSLFFTHSTSTFGGITEMAASGSRSNTFTSTDISIHIPGYFPAGVSRMVGSAKHNMLFVLDDPPRNSSAPDFPDMAHEDFGRNQGLTVYTYADTSDGRLQSAFTAWDFNRDLPTGVTTLASMPTGYTILNMAIMGDSLYLITGTASIRDTGGVGERYGYEYYLEKIDLDLKTEDTLVSDTLKENFNQCLLDRKTANTEVTESFNGAYTLITPPWAFDASMADSLEVVTAAGARYTVGKGNLIPAPATSSTPCTLRVTGVDLTGLAYWVGFGYTMTSTFGPFAPQIQNTPLRGRNVFVRGARLTYTRANEFNVDVIHGGTTYTEKVVEGTTTGTKSGEMYFGIRQHMPDLSFTIYNSLPWNAMFQGIMYDLNIQEVLR